MTKYDENSIKTLSSLDHIRLRSGMYVGRLGDGSNFEDGIYILIKEIVDNAIDEFIMGHGRKIEIKRDDDGTITVRDYGRGIPLGKLKDAVSQINTGAKYNDEVFQFSVGLNGVGTKAVNALSEHFHAVSFRDGAWAEAIFAAGVLKKHRQGKKSSQKDGTWVQFRPDHSLFGEYQFNEEFILQRLWNYAYLNAGLAILYNKQKIFSNGGLKDLLANEVGDAELYGIAHYRDERLEFALTHTSNYGETYFSFVNGQFTADGGTHQSAFREGVLKGVNEFFKKNYAGEDVREGIAGAVAVRLKEPQFEGQTKNKLGNSDIRGWIVNQVREAVADFLFRNQGAAKKLEAKITQNEKLRKELNTVRKESREAAKRISLKIPKLKDCKFHRGDRDKRGEESTIFITEGDSATGSMVGARDVYTQAIFSLRGKPQNMYAKKRGEIYRNEELYNMMMALGIEEDVATLRYQRIVIATDADHDGFHIRNLLLTFFLQYFEELVVANHMYILETPLFRVRNKKETRYCYSEAERARAVQEIRGAEVTRFKGLGEISPREFGQFIGEDMRIVPVNLKTIKDIQETLTFFMGKNTPERRAFIMENLI
ncbi:topoisomerase-4 subunit B [Alkalispirochaeta americana]|uniref:DNA topoisomerase (ATP-hydrolyzing) n=1 Tax=Alkalispirochaeta americana TaxID=159291 RepID=A0A1N6VPS4_9SPIO|nr:DNA topoisomerase IV subunit B [Alkalispirochaeta americana]SIQ79804.1 topoisomerase-4 subunit B [Alkalispirochaeta americana]